MPHLAESPRDACERFQRRWPEKIRHTTPHLFSSWHQARQTHQSRQRSTTPRLSRPIRVKQMTQEKHRPRSRRLSPKKYARPLAGIIDYARGLSKLARPSTLNIRYTASARTKKSTTAPMNFPIAIVPK